MGPHSLAELFLGGSVPEKVEIYIRFLPRNFVFLPYKLR